MDEFAAAKGQLSAEEINADVFDIHLQPCDHHEIMSNIYEQVKKLVEDNTVLSAGMIFKMIWTTILNRESLLTSMRIIVGKEKQHSDKQVSEENSEARELHNHAIAVYNKFVESGRALDKDKYSDLSKEEITFLLKFILSLVALGDSFISL